MFRLPALPHMLLRLGVAFAFLYPPIAALRDPISWFAYFPPFLQTLSPESGLILLHGFGVLEVILALWILSGRSIQYPAALATVLLLCIVYVNSVKFDVVFRDLSIAAMSAALAIDAWQKSKTS